MISKIKIMKLFLLITLIFVVIFGIFAVNQLFASEKEPCTTCDDQVSYQNNGNGFTDSQLDNMQEDINKNNYEYKVGNNPATKYELEELCGLEPELLSNSNIKENTILKSNVQASLPASYDLRTKGLTSIKDQKTCGCCWAFGTAGVLENVIKLNENKTVDLSEQWLINCNKNGYGCNGGWYVFDMFKNNGAVYEEDVPYANGSGSCKTNLTYHEKINSWAYVGSASSNPSVDQLKQAIYSYGPVVAAVYSDNKFQAYSGGIYESTLKNAVNHAIILVGWDDSKNAWILRNSWGARWGESGYMYIAYNSNSIGTGAAYINYSANKTINPEPTKNSSINPTATNSLKPTATNPAIITANPTSSSSILPKPSNSGNILPMPTNTSKITPKPTKKPSKNRRKHKSINWESILNWLASR